MAFSLRGPHESAFTNALRSTIATAVVIQGTLKSARLQPKGFSYILVRPPQFTVFLRGIMLRFVRAAVLSGFLVGCSSSPGTP